MTGPTFSSSEQVGHRTSLRSEKPQARSSLMTWVLVGYFVVLALGVAVPFVAALWLSSEQLGSFREVMQQTSGLSQGLFGILGVIVGYYFKEENSGTAPGSPVP